LIQIAPALAAENPSRRIADEAALGILVRISPRKRKLIRAAEAFLRPFVRLIESLRGSAVKTSPGVQSILVVEYWNIGDIAMELPFLENLRVHYPDAHIAILTSPKCVPLLADRGWVDEVIVVRVPWAQHYSRWKKYNPFSPLWFKFLGILRTLRTRKFDLAFAARADLRENFILWLINAHRRVGYGFGGGGFLLTDAAVPDLERPHFSNLWLRLLEHLGKPILTRQPHLRLEQVEHEWAGKYLAEIGVKSHELVIGIHPGARSAIRQWGEENFLAVAEKLLANFAVRILWFQDPGQQRPTLKSSRSIAVSLPLPQFMAILNRCNLLICNDSGPMHIATALDVPVVGIFGPGEPAWWAPLGEGHRVVIRPEFWCRPCFDYCIFDQPYCLRLVTVESVYEAAAGSLRAISVEPNCSIGLSAREPAHVPMKMIPRVERAAD
jgi:ADP-heptose:LPS heptosyltransferase